VGLPQALWILLLTDGANNLTGRKPMSTAGSVTHWLAGLKAGDPAPAQRLWENYFRRLLVRARQKLAGTPRRR
jgi:hypothetical protein